MIKSTGMIDTKKFNYKFKKSFNNFCQKSPLQLDINMTDTGIITILAEGEKEPIVYQIDYMLKPKEHEKNNYGDEIIYAVKRNIRYIKNRLLKIYPVLKGSKTVSDEEKANLVNILMAEKQLSYKEALDEVINSLKTEKLGEPRYKIMRILMSANELNIYDMKERQLKLYKLNMPLIMFMEEVYSDIDKASMTFKAKANYIKDI